MISQSSKSILKGNIAQPVFNENSFIQSVLNDNLPNESKAKILTENDYCSENNLNKLESIKTENNLHGERSGNASSTTSHVSQTIMKKVTSSSRDIKDKRNKYLSKKTKRKSSQGIKEKKINEAPDTLPDSQLNANLKDGQISSTQPEIKFQSIPYHNPDYPELNFLEDLKKIEGNARHSFMMNYFPTMYQPRNFYKNIKCLNERRRTHKEIFIINEELITCQKEFFLNEIEMKNSCRGRDIPLKVWSVPKEELDYEEFYSKCIEVWPFGQCCFIKEFALEYLMKKNYDMNACLNDLDDFVLFVKTKTIENNIPVMKTDVKFVKNYSLRKTKKTIYR